MRKKEFKMTMDIKKFNEEVKTIDLQLVSLKETWDSIEGKNKYQVKYGDIFMTIKESGDKEYYLYQDIGKAYHVTSAIKEYLEKENVVALENFDFLFDHTTDYWFYECEGAYFTTALDEEGLVVEQGIEGYEGLAENIVSVHLIHINKKTMKVDFVEEWKNKVIVSDYDISNTYGMLGDKTSVEGVFVGDMYELYDSDADERETYTVLEVEEGKYAFRGFRRYDQDLEWVFKQAQMEVEEALADGLTEDEVALYLPKKHKSYKNLTDTDVYWTDEGLELIDND